LFWLPRFVPVRNFVTLSRGTNVIGAVALIGVLGINAVSTYEDYFIKWPAHPETQFVFQADFAAIAKDIDASDVLGVSVGGLSNDTMDDDSLYLLRQRKDVRVRWFDSGSPISSGGAVVVSHDTYMNDSIYVPAIVPISDQLNWAMDMGPDWQVPHFRRYHGLSLLCCDLPEKYQREFSDTGVLFAWERLAGLDSIRIGGDFRFTSKWLANGPIESPRRIFVHLVDPKTGEIIAQHDGLDAPTKFWHKYDEIAQVHTLTIPANTPPGKYEVRIGLYNPVTGQRILQTDAGHTEPPADYYLLGTIEVVP
jgi:hypothetical protein